MGALDFLTKNPSILALAGLGIVLFVFRDRISGFFSDITGGVQGAAALGETVGVLNENLLSNLKGIQDILSGDIFAGFKLPEFQFPEFKFPEITLPSIVGPAPFVGPERQDVSLGDTGQVIDIVPDTTGGRADRLDAVINPDQTNQLPFTTVQQFIDLFGPKGDTVIPDEPETSQLNAGQFQGIATEAPLGAFSLSRIIDEFMVTASQAANIKFISQQGGDPFASPENIFGENPPAVSDPSFTGLSPEEIALRLTGGNISNF